MVMDEKILTKHPLGKQGVNISKEKYDVIRESILDILRIKPRITFKELSAAVDNRLSGEFNGSIPWYVTTVKLDLEAREIIKRVSSSSPQYLEIQE